MCISKMVDNKDILALVNILRKVTVIVKICPFIYTVLYALCMFGYLSMSESVATILDQLFYTSPIVVVNNLVLSRSLKLCKWHRLECILPIIPLLPLAIDSYICPLNNVAVGVNTAIMTMLCIASLINAYFVFIKPKQ